MKKYILVLLSTLALATSGCSGAVSQENYNVIQQENEKLTKENQALKDKSSAEQAKYDAAKLWADAQFSSATSCIVGDNTIVVNVNTQYLASSADVVTIRNEFIKAATALLTAGVDSSFISVNYYALDGVPIIFFDLKQQAGAPYALNGVMLNTTYAIDYMSLLTTSGSGSSDSGSSSHN